MKMLIAPLFLTALLAGCSDESGTTETAAIPGETMAPAATQSASTPMAGRDAYKATASGTIESVDPAANRIVIAHGPVEALKWPAMKMGFIATPEQVSALEVGQKVDFEFLSHGANNTITSITPAE